MGAMPDHILVIEDEPSVAENVTYALETEGFAFTWCSTGREGLAALEAREISLVILDVGLSDTDGFEICRHIRASRDLPIVFLTARSDEIDRVVGLEIGADDYVVKPFSPRELTARVKAILRRGKRPASDATARAVREVPPFMIDGERFEIAYHGSRLPLTRYEYRILEVLLSRPGRVYSRAALMDQAWEEPEASMERTVDAHIKGIRAKLRAIRKDVDVIITHRGLGYALEIPAPDAPSS